MSVELITLGCRLNIAESETIRAGLGRAGDDDLVIVNSCAVTAEAVAQTRKALRRARRDRPGVRIVVTGCASEIEPEAFAGLADIVVPNARKTDIGLYRRPGLDPGPRLPLDVGEGSGVRHHGFIGAIHARAFIPVQNGCDHACTFCIIPQGRGANRSLPAGAVIADVEAALARGAKEIVLTGVDLTSYGGDLPGAPTLAGLVARILKLTPVARLRLSSLDPAATGDALVELITSEARIMPHVHLSLQAGDDMILKRMRRRHGRGDAIRLVERLKRARPEIAIGADLIAGFPTESAVMAANSLRLIEECDIVFAHVFPYSPRAGTPAARMPQLEREVIRARAAGLRAAGEARRAAWLRGHIGTVQRVLIELDGTTGHAEDFARVSTLRSITSPSVPGVANRIADIRIADVEGDTLIGMPA